MDIHTHTEQVCEVEQLAEQVQLNELVVELERVSTWLHTTDTAICASQSIAMMIYSFVMDKHR